MSQKSSETIRALQSIFTRHGIPNIFRSGDGPKFVSTEFDEFSNEYSFTLVTSSQKLPQANGKAKRAVETINILLKKEKKNQLKLSCLTEKPHWKTPYSPAEMLFGR